MTWLRQFYVRLLIWFQEGDPGLVLANTAFVLLLLFILVAAVLT